jgi:hypothetical protein
VSTLNLWTVYIKPIDYPGKVVVRRFELDHPTGDVHTFESVGPARRWILENTEAAVRFPREPADDPCILETWL